MRALKQLLLGPLKVIRIDFGSYKIYAVVAYLLVPVIIAIDTIFRGKFVGMVNYLGKSVDYLLFIAVGLAMSSAVQSILNDTDFIMRKMPVMLIKAVHPLIIPVSSVLSSLLKDLVYFFFLSVVLHVFGGVNYIKVLLTLVVAYTFGLPLIMALGILYSIFGLFFRGKDFSAVRRLVDRALWILLPIYYSFEVYPIKEGALLLPTVALIEGTRRWVLGFGGGELLTYAFLTGILLLAISYALYQRTFEWSRRTGRILLE